MNVDVNETARERRMAAARVSRDLATEEDLEALLGIAKHGLGELFDGECTIQLGIGSQYIDNSKMEWIPFEGLPDEVVTGLSEPRATTWPLSALVYCWPRTATAEHVARGSSSTLPAGSAWRNSLSAIFSLKRSQSRWMGW